MTQRQHNTSGGGAKTNEVGLRFERATSIEDSLVKNKYKIKAHQIFKGNVVVGELYPKNKLYNILLAGRKINHTEIISKKLLPDQAILVGNVMYIIENKYQAGSGSVDEKLQTCHYKKRQYTKLLFPLGITVEYIYLLNEWFKRPEYKDVLDYIQEVECHYFFDEIPLKFLGL